MEPYFRLNGVSNAYLQEYRILTNDRAESRNPCACTSGSLFWAKGGVNNHLLCDIGFGVWESLVNFQLAKRQITQLSGILLTHAHLDHIGELAVFVESWQRLNNYQKPVQVYATESTFNQIQDAYPWLFSPKKNAKQVKENIVANGSKFSIGEVQITPIDASSHCKGGVNFLLEFSGCNIFLGWDINRVPEGIDWCKVDLAFLDGNSIHSHPTGH